MSDSPVQSLWDDFDRTIRVSDQSCTGHAILRDRYQWRSTCLDLVILIISACLLATVWIQPDIADKLTPFSLPREIWIGLLSLGAFCLSLVQLQVNWKERANSHNHALATLSTYIKELRALRGSSDAHRIASALERYQAVTEPLRSIPESEFLRLKQRHLLKVAASKHLDKHPGSSLLLFRLALLWRNNVALLSCEPRQDGKKSDVR